MNVDIVETCTWFDTAVGDAVHCSCRFTSTSLMLSAGLCKTGAAGGCVTGVDTAARVVNCRTADQDPCPAPFTARTLQKYVVLKLSEVRAYAVPVIPLWSRIVARNADEAATCT